MSDTPLVILYALLEHFNKMTTEKEQRNNWPLLIGAVRLASTCKRLWTVYAPLAETLRKRFVIMDVYDDQTRYGTKPCFPNGKVHGLFVCTKTYNADTSPIKKRRTAHCGSMVYYESHRVCIKGSETKQVPYRNGKKHGVAHYTRIGVWPKEEHVISYRDGKRHGVEIYDHATAAVAIHCETEWWNGFRHGLVVNTRKEYGHLVMEMRMLFNNGFVDGAQTWCWFRPCEHNVDDSICTCTSCKLTCVYDKNEIKSSTKVTLDRNKLVKQIVSTYSGTDKSMREHKVTMEIGRNGRKRVIIKDCVAEASAFCTNWHPGDILNKTA